MFKIAIVVFRECLEIALLLGVVMAVTNPIKNSKVYIILGTMLGIIGAAVFALFARSITSSFSGLGDELIDVVIILLTSLLISWTVVWMQGYTHKIRKNLSSLSEKIVAGNASKLTLVIVVMMAILREGSEIILFIYSISSTENLHGDNYLIGLGSGAFSGLLVGTILYKGLLKYTGKYVFLISTILLTLIAAGLASEAAGILTSAGFIELFSEPLWDTSLIVSNASILGKILNIFIGYDSRPNGMQVIFYLSTISLTLGMMQLQSKFAQKKI